MNLRSIHLGARISRNGALLALLLALSPLSALAQNGAQAGPTADPKIADKVAQCGACHGLTGNSTDPQYPVLAGQTMRYMYLQLKDFKEGRRTDPVMSAMATPLTRDEMLALSDYFSKQKVAPIKFKVDEAKAKLGKAKSDEVLCPMCHLGGFVGQNEIPKNSGQHYAYIVKQLKDFKTRKRTNDAGNMTAVAGTLSDADIENLGHYIAGL